MSRSRSGRRPEQLAELGRVLRHLSSQMGFLNQAVAERLGLNTNDLACLGLLDADGPMTAGQLAETTGLSTGAITGVVDRLERGGFVRRGSDPADRRRVVVQLVDERTAEIAEAFAPIVETTTQLTAGYDAAQLDLVVDFARRSADLLRTHAADFRAPATRRGEPLPLTAPLGRTRSGRLHLANGAKAIVVRASEPTDDLFQARFERATPDVSVDAGVVTIRYVGSPIRLARARASVALNPAVPWRITAERGLAGAELDLTELRPLGLDVRGGVSDAAIALPAPSGTVALRFDGGVHHLRVQRPGATPVRVRVRRGANDLRVDDLRLGAVGGDFDWRTTGYDDAADRYDIEVSGGANRFEVVAHPR